jgi:hypothetical protein
MYVPIDVFYFTMKQPTTSKIYLPADSEYQHPSGPTWSSGCRKRLASRQWPFSPPNADDGCVIGSTCANKKDDTDNDHHHHHNDTNEPTGCAAHGS